VLLTACRTVRRLGWCCRDARVRNKVAKTCCCRCEDRCAGCLLTTAQSPEAVAWTTARRRLSLDGCACLTACRRLSLVVYDGSEEAVAALAPGAFDGSEEACRQCCRRLSLCERLSVWLLLLLYRRLVGCHGELSPSREVRLISSNDRDKG
jgi:hypothetical protein